MNRSARLVLLVPGLLVLALVVATAAARADSLLHDGRQRTYETVVPAGTVLPAPTLLVLHGGRGNVAQMRRLSGLDRAADRLGMVTVFPQGIENQWNDGRAAPAAQGRQGERPVDDVGFLRALAAGLADAGIADPRRTYVTGVSNGGMMAFRLLCEAADRFAGFVPVIANLPEQLADCRPVRPAPVLLMNGTADRLILWEGGPVAGMFPGDRGRTISTAATITRLRALNGCNDAVETGAERDLGNDIRLAVTRWPQCDAGSEIALYRFEGMGHRWPGTRIDPGGAFADLLGKAPADFDMPAVLRDFLQRFSLD